MADVTKSIFDFTDYIAERTQDFTGREWVFAEIDDWLANPNAPRYFIITGEPGIGKTALAARLTQIRQLDAVHFCIARQVDTIDPLNFVRSISHQLTHIEGFVQNILKEKNVKIDVHISNVREVQGNVIGVQIENLMGGAESAAIAFSRVVASPLRQLYADGFDRQIVILVDALDEAVRQPGAETIVSLLENARSLPEQIRFLLTARPDADALRYFEELKLPYLLLDAGREENLKDIREYVTQHVEASDVLQTRLHEKNTSKKTFVERVTTASQGNFLYLVWLLRGITEGTQQFEALDDLPDGLDGIYREFLRTRTVGKNRKDWQTMYRPLLGILAVAQAPLTVEQISKFSGLSEQDVNDLLLDLRQFLTPGHSEQGQYQLYHQSLPDFFQNRERAKEFWIDLTPFHQQIVDFYQKQFAGHWEHCNQYGFRYLPVHLIRSGQQEILRELLFTFEWLKAKLTATDINALLADYDLALAAPEETEDEHTLRLVQSALRLSAHILAQDAAQLPSQLHGRLCSQTTPGIKKLLIQARSKSLWLRPFTCSLTSPGGALLRTFTGHTDGVRAVAVTPDGRQVVSASEDGILKVWDLLSGEVLRTLTGHMNGVYAVAVTPDGTQVIAASYDRTLKVWDLKTGEERRTLTRYTSFLTAVAVTPDGRQVVWDSWDCTMPLSRSHTLKVWDLESGEERHTLTGHTDFIKAVAVTPDGQQMVSASSNKTLKVWDLASGKEQRTLTGHKQAVTAIAVTPDGRQIVSASRDRTLKVWDLASGEERQTLISHTAEVRAVAVTPDGGQVVSASSDKTLKVWELAVGEERRTLTGHTSVVNAVAVTPDGTQVVLALSDKAVKVWDLASGEKRHTLTGHTSVVYTVVVTPDGMQMVSASDDRTLKIWDLASGEELRTLTGHTSGVTAVAVTPDGRQVVSASHDTTLKVWDLTSGEKRHTLTGHTSEVYAVAVTPDGTQVVSASDDRTLKVWDLTSGAEQRTLTGHKNAVMAVAVTPNGRQIVSASDDRTLKVWDLASGEELRTLTGHTDLVTAVALTPDGGQVVSASWDKTLKVWDLNTGDLLTTFHADADLLCCAVAPDGLTIVAGDWLENVHFLRVEKGELQD